jgi:hypothetical protein
LQHSPGPSPSILGFSLFSLAFFPLPLSLLPFDPPYYTTLPHPQSCVYVSHKSSPWRASILWPCRHI